jgi:uncharacterized membrane-anchored protein
MKKLKSGLIVLNLLVFLWLFNSSIVESERLLKEGDLVFFELAPVDPRSLMQGDYMRLNYAIMNSLDMEDVYPVGYLIFHLDNNYVAQFRRLAKDRSDVGNGERIIKYQLGKRFFFSRRPFVRIGAESYFFQEGQAERFEAAKFGGLKINKNGESILVGLYNEDFERI